MKPTPLFLFLCCLIGFTGTLFGQHRPKPHSTPAYYNSREHIWTDSGTYTGRIVALTDSSISLVQLKDRNRIDISAANITTIRIKKRFFRSVLMDSFIGAFTPTLILLGIAGKGDVLPSGKVILYTLAGGAAIGMAYGIGESIFYSVSIPVNKDVTAFRLQKCRLVKFCRAG